MKYSKIKSVTNLDDSKVYSDGAVYLTGPQATALEAALENPAAENTAELQSQLETSNTDLAAANARIESLQADNAALQSETATLRSENTKLKAMPAANATKTGGEDDQPEEGVQDSAEFDHADPNLPQNQYAMKLGIKLK